MTFFVCLYIINLTSTVSRNCDVRKGGGIIKRKTIEKIEFILILVLGGALIVAVIIGSWLHFLRGFDTIGGAATVFDFDNFLRGREDTMQGRLPAAFVPRINGFEFNGRRCVYDLGVGAEELKAYFLEKHVAVYEKEWHDNTIRLGLKNRVQGDVLINARYKEGKLNFNSWGAIGEFEGRFYVYYNTGGTVKWELVGVSYEWVGLWNTYGFVIRGAEFFDVRVGAREFCFLQPFIIDGFRVLSPAVSDEGEWRGVVLISEYGVVIGDEFKGFWCFEQEVLLTELKFISLSVLENNAVMGITLSGTYFLWICNDEAGVRGIFENRVANGVEIFGFNEYGYAVFRKNGGNFGVKNRNFEVVVEAVFNDLYRRVFKGEFLLCRMTSAFFNFDASLASDVFKSVLMLDSRHFVVHNISGLFSLLWWDLYHLNMQVSEYEYIFEFEFIIYIDDTILILYDNYIWFFERR